jgi:hypothetical protein
MIFQDALHKLAELFPEKFQVSFSEVPSQRDTIFKFKGGGGFSATLTQDQIDTILESIGWEYTVGRAWSPIRSFRYSIGTIEGNLSDHIHCGLSYDHKLDAARAALVAVVEKL